MQLSRRLAPAAALAFLGLAVCLSPAQALDPKILPADTEVIIQVNVQQILKSEVAKANKDLINIAKTMLEQKLAEKNVTQYLEKAGFDLFRDLVSVTVASPGTKEPEAGFIVIEGKFDAEKLYAVLEDVTKESGDVKSVKINGIKAFEITPNGEKTLYAGVVKNMLLATGSRDGFSDAVGRINGSKTTTLKKELKSLLETTGTKQSISIVATGPAIGRMLENAPVPNADQAMAALGNLDGVALSIAVEKNINFQIGVNAKDKMTAEQLAKTSNAGVMMARAFVKKKAEDDTKAATALEIVNTLRVTSQNNNVLIRGEITFETLGKLLENLPLKQ